MGALGSDPQCLRAASGASGWKSQGHTSRKEGPRHGSPRTLTTTSGDPEHGRSDDLGSWAGPGPGPPSDITRVHGVMPSPRKCWSLDRRRAWPRASCPPVPQPRSTPLSQVLAGCPWDSKGPSQPRLRDGDRLCGQAGLTLWGCVSHPCGSGLCGQKETSADRRPFVNVASGHTFSVKGLDHENVRSTKLWQGFLSSQQGCGRPSPPLHGFGKLAVSARGPSSGLRVR